MRADARLQAAIEILDLIVEARAPSDSIVRRYFRRRRYAGSKDRAAVADLVYDALHRYSTLCWSGAESTGRSLFLHHLAGRGDGVNAVRALFSGVDYGPRALTEAEVAALSGSKDKAVAMPDWAAGNFPAWLEASLRRRFGADLVPEMAALSRQADFDLRVNLLSSDRDRVLAQLRADGLAAAPTAYSPWGLRLAAGVRITEHRLYKTGAVEVQDEGSQLAAFVSAAKPGMEIAEIGAGAGGKTLALAAMMENSGRIHALDVDARRLARLRPRLERAGVEIVEAATVGDGDDDPWYLSRQGDMDMVLLDAPCSGTGTWRRHPEQRLRLTSADLVNYCRLQAKLLDRARALVKPGGRLCYVTCSLLPEENEDQIDALLERRPDLRPEPYLPPWGGPAVAMAQLTPKTHRTDGFFIACLRKSG